MLYLQEKENPHTKSQFPLNEMEHLPTVQNSVSEYAVTTSYISTISGLADHLHLLDCTPETDLPTHYIGKNFAPFLA
jgi:hypothetical protein